MAYCMYLRKSRADIEAEERGEGETLARHEKILLELAKKMGLNVTKIYKEIGSGETISSRPVMQQLLRDVEEGMWEGVLVVEVERLARGDTIDQGIVAQTFKYSNTKIITPIKVYDPQNEFDEEYFEFGLFMSRREYKVINRRLQRGRLESVKEGKYVGNKPPYGYRRKKLEKDKGYTLVPHPEESRVVKQIFEWYVNGIGVSQIVRKLNDMKIPAANGGDWVNASVQGILQNPVYIGKIRWNFRPQIKKVINGQTVVQRPRNKEWLVVDGLHEPIIDEETFRMAQERLAKNPSVPIPRKYVIKNPLAGLIVCGICGRKMVRRPFNDGRPDILMCQYTSCKNVSTRFELVESRLLQALEIWLKDYKLELNENGEYSNNSEDIELIKTSLSRIEKELETLNVQYNRLHDLLEQGVYSVDKFIERSRILSERIETTKKEKEELQKVLEDISFREESKRLIVPKIEGILESYYNIQDPAEKNKLLKEVIEKAVYTKTVKGSRWHLDRQDDFELVIYPKLPKK